MLDKEVDIDGCELKEETQLVLLVDTLLELANLPLVWLFPFGVAFQLSFGTLDSWIACR